MEYLVIGILIGLAAWGLASWAKTRQLSIAWYTWLLLALAVGLGVLAYQNYSVSLEEFEPQAASFLLMSFGVPALVLAGVAGFLMWRTAKPSAPKR